MGRSWADHGQTIGDRFMQNPENFSFFRHHFFPKIYENLQFRTRLEQSVKLFLRTPLVAGRWHPLHTLIPLRDLVQNYYKEYAISR